jgi:hypothetical protein
MRGKPSKFVCISDIVDCVGRITKGVVNVDWVNKLVPEARLVLVKTARGWLALSFSATRRAVTQSQAQTLQRIVLTHARKRLLLFYYTVLLELPTHVSMVDKVGFRQCSGE